MPKLYSADPRRLGYTCDDYDLPVRDLATDICYQNYCAAEAAGVKNWDYECDPEIRFPAPTDDAGAAPAPEVVSGGGGDGGWAGNGWIGDGGFPWRRRRRAGHGGPSAPPSGGGSTPPGRVLIGGPRPGRTILPGSDSDTPGRRMGGGTPFSGGTIRRGGGIHSNPPGSSGGGLTLVGSDGGATLATAGGVIHSNPPGSGGGATLLPGDGGSTLATAMTYHPAAVSAAPMRPTMQYHAQPTTAVTALRSTTSVQATPLQRAASTMAPSKPSYALSAGARQALTSRGGGRTFSRGLRGLGQAGSVSSGWQYAALGLGALVVAQFFWWNAKAPQVLKLGSKRR